MEQHKYKLGVIGNCGYMAYINDEADVAWMSWVHSDLARTGRELIPFGWCLRRARPADLPHPPNIEE